MLVCQNKKQRRFTASDVVGRIGIFLLLEMKSSRFGTFALITIALIYNAIYLNSYYSPFFLFYLYFSRMVCERPRVYACVRGHARAYMFCSGVYWHTPVVCRDLAEAFFLLKKKCGSIPSTN